MAKAARQLYDILPNENLTSEHSHIDSPGFARRKDEGGSYVIGSPRQGYTLDLTKSRIGLRESVTWEMRKYDRILSLLWVTIVEKLSKLRETLFETIRSQARIIREGSTTIMGVPRLVG